MNFGHGSVPVAVAAKVYGKDPAWVRAGIVCGYLPIGIATRNGKTITDIKDIDSKYGRTNFYISPKKLYDDTGYIWRGKMSTDIRPELSRDHKYWISKHRYYELKHFCLQYHEWEHDLLYLNREHTSSIINPGARNTISDYTGSVGTKRAYLQKKIDTLRRLAIDTDPEIGSYILKAVTDGLSYENLKTVHEIPCGRDMYYDRYRKFFWLLDKEL